MAEAFGDPCKLWMGDLDPYMDEAFLRSAFKSFNFDLVAVRWIRNHTTGENAKYCFLEFPSALHAKAILENLSQQAIPGASNGKRFKLNWATKPKDAGIAEHDLYVANLSPEISTAELLEFFQKNYNSVRIAKVVADESGTSRGFGFVKFADMEERDRCVAEIDGMMFGNKPMTVRAGSIPQPTAESTDPYQGSQMGAGLYFGGYMYGQAPSGYYDYSQMANYSQYSPAVTNQVYQSPSPAVPGSERFTPTAAHDVPTSASGSQAEGDGEAKVENDPKTRLHFRSPTESVNAMLMFSEKDFFMKTQLAKWDFGLWGKDLVILS